MFSGLLETNGELLLVTVVVKQRDEVVENVIIAVVLPEGVTV